MHWGSPRGQRSRLAIALRLALMASLLPALIHNAVAGEDGKIALRCSLDKSTDLKTKTTLPMADTRLIVFTPTSGPFGTIKADDIEELFTATLSDMEIRGEVAYKLRGSDARERMVINRYNGAVSIVLDVADVKLEFTGSCTKLAQPLF
jgi:hypothetical protein